jgi:hypothetical protein
LAAFGFTMLGDALRALLDPRLKGAEPGRLRRETLDATDALRQSQGVDQELVSYLDRRFSELKSELRTEIAASAEGIKSELRAEIVASAAGVKSELRAEITASAAETRRHFEVVADRLMDKIQLVGEGVIGVDQKLDRFRGEVAEEFRRVDRRLLRLEARSIG